MESERGVRGVKLRRSVDQCKIVGVWSEKSVERNRFWRDI